VEFRAAVEGEAASGVFGEQRRPLITGTRARRLLHPRERPLARWARSRGMLHTSPCAGSGRRCARHHRWSYAFADGSSLCPPRVIVPEALGAKQGERHGRPPTSHEHSQGSELLLAVVCEVLI